jgi:DNA-binding transcriptional regulator YbjK
VPGLPSGFDEVIAEIYKTLAEINAEAMYGLHQRSQRIEEKAIESGKAILDLKCKAEAAEQDRQKLFTQNAELLERNKKLEAMLEEQRQNTQQREQEDEERMLHSFEDFLGVSYPLLVLFRPDC